jgi:G3E family GTPase
MLSETQREKLDQWIRTLLWEGVLFDFPGNVSVHRTKGRIVMQNGQEWMLQGVREVYEFREMGKSHEDKSKIVLIGEGLEKENIANSLYRYLGI